MNRLVISNEDLAGMLKKDANLLHSVAHKFRIDGYTHEDLFQECALKYVQVIRKGLYNPEMAKLSTYMFKSLLSWMSTLYNRQNKRRTSVQLVTGMPALNGAVTSASPSTSGHSIEYDYDEMFYLDDVFKLINEYVDEFSALLVINRIKGYKESATLRAYKAKTGKSFSRQAANIIYQRALKKLEPILKKHGVI